MRLTSAAVAAVACAAAALLLGSPSADAAAKPAPPAKVKDLRTWTVEHRVGRELIIITYRYPLITPSKYSGPPELDRSMKRVDGRDVPWVVRKYTFVPGDAVSIWVLLPRDPPAKKHCSPKKRHHCTHRGHHIDVDTGFGGAASTVARHVPAR